MDIIPFKPEHITMIDVQQAQTSDDACVRRNDDYGKWLATTGPAITGMVDGRVIFCVGKAKQWEGRHIIWSVLSKDAGKYLLRITKALRRILMIQEGEGRLELIVRADFKNGCDWASVLGFEQHHFEEKFLPDGADAWIYVRHT
jgi:hypothetical protein